MTLEMVLCKQVVGLNKDKHELLQTLKDLEYLLDLKLPVDVKIGGETNKAGTTIRTLAYQIRAFNGYIDPNDIEELKQTNEGCMKPIIIERFDICIEAEEYVNKKFLEGYRMISFSTYKDVSGLLFVVCMELAKFERVGKQNEN